MQPQGFRRIFLLISIILFTACLWIWLGTRPKESEGGALLYKVRAYTTSKIEAGKIKKIGKSLGFQGKTTKGRRTINKFMGYTVSQDFSARGQSDNAAYILDYLKAQGYKAKVTKDSAAKTYTIQVGGYFREFSKAQKVAKIIYKKTQVTFDVKKCYKETPYQAFIVLFSQIPDKEKALKLENQIKTVCTDVETISY